MEAGGAHQINGAVDSGMGAGLKEQQLRRAEAQNLDGVTGAPGRAFRHDVVEDPVDLPLTAKYCRDKEADETAITLFQIAGMPHRLIKMPATGYILQSAEGGKAAGKAGLGRLAGLSAR
jgi:hypothetical protein